MRQTTTSSKVLPTQKKSINTGRRTGPSVRSRTGKLVASRSQESQKRVPSITHSKQMPSTPKSNDEVIYQITDLSRDYDFTNSMVASILDVTTKTLSRYQESSKPLSIQQADRIRVVESILELGKHVLGTELEVKKWLHEPVLSLENQKPIDLIVTESGRRRVENVLLQIEGGVY